MNIKKILGRNIKKYRKKANLTQDGLAEKLNISSKHLSNIEVGQKFVSAQLLEKIIQIFDMSPSSLFYIAGENPSDDNPLETIDRIIDEQSKTFAENLKKKISEEL